MFDFLDTYPIEQITSAIYYAIRNLRHLKNVEVETLESEKYLNEKDLGLKIISAIVDYEGKLLSDFDIRTKDRYVTALYDYLDKKHQKNLKLNRSTELGNLQKWRNESVHHYDIKNYNYNYSKKVFISYNKIDRNVFELKNILNLVKVDTIEWADIVSYPNIPPLNFIESISSVAFAVFIINNQEDLKFRNNLLFELGYLFGKLGRDNILILLDIKTPMPIDLQGLPFLEKNNKDWKFQFIKRLDFSGINFDKSALDILK